MSAEPKRVVVSEIERLRKVAAAARALLRHDDAADERERIEPCVEAEALRAALAELDAAGRAKWRGTYDPDVFVADVGPLMAQAVRLPGNATWSLRLNVRPASGTADSLEAAQLAAEAAAGAEPEPYVAIEWRRTTPNHWRADLPDGRILHVARWGKGYSATLRAGPGKAERWADGATRYDTPDDAKAAAERAVWGKAK